jgi:(p)ppGpp synthase/HD superfamily hydrolase
MKELYNHQSATPSPEQLSLKEKNTYELFALLQEATTDWLPGQQRQLDFAFDMVMKAHADDRHKDRPYTEHLLRVANRMAHYMEIDDPDTIIAGMLHDIVEDHAQEIINGSLITDDGMPLPGSEHLDRISSNEKQVQALQHIEILFTPRVADIVAAVTNVPDDQAPADYGEKLQAYAAKVAMAIEDIDAFYVKVGDWCDNGLGINHDIEGQGDRRGHYIRKYGLVLPVFQARFEREDLQTAMSDKAKRYLRTQFELGRERLL